MQLFLVSRGYNIGPVDGFLIEQQNSSMKAFQEFLKDHGEDPGPIDGIFDVQTICAWQRFLKYKAKNPVKKKIYMQHLSPLTHPKADTYFNVTADGINGKKTALATQKFLAAQQIEVGPLDGSWGDATSKGVQKYLVSKGYNIGPIDGNFHEGHHSTIAFQKWLRDVG